MFSHAAQYTDDRAERQHSQRACSSDFASTPLHKLSFGATLTPVMMLRTTTRQGGCAMAKTMTLDEEFRKTLRDHAAGASGANERFALTTVRLVADNIDGDVEIWTFTAQEAEARARKYRLVAAYALRGAAICEDHANDARVELTVSVQP
jgi:hypothetical protein